MSVSPWSTGDELAEAAAGAVVGAGPGAGPVGGGGGLVYDANRPMLAAAAAAAGAEVVDLGAVRDEPGALAAAVGAAAAAGADVLLTSGGVSEGDKDFLKQVLRGEHGGGIAGDILFGRVMMKPGKPLTFAEVRLVDDGSRGAEDGKGGGGGGGGGGGEGGDGGGGGGGGGGVRPMLVFAVPGNPVSAAVTFQLVVVPALRRLAGWRDPRLRRLHVVLAADLALDPVRPEYHRATLDWQARTVDAAGAGAGAGAGPAWLPAGGAAPPLPIHFKPGRYACVS